MSVLLKTFFNLHQQCSKRVLLRLCAASSHVRSGPYSSKGALSRIEALPVDHVYLRQCRRFDSALAIKKAKRREATEMPVALVAPELTHMHSTFENSIHYQETIVTLPTATQILSDEDVQNILKLDWSTLNTAEKLNAFKKLSHHSISNDRYLSPNEYEHVMESISEVVPELNLVQVEKLLRYMVPLQVQFMFNNEYVNLQCKILNHYENMIPKLSVKQLLLMADLFFHLRLNSSKAMRHTLRRLGSKPQKLTANNLVQLLFYMSISGKSQVNMYEMEYLLGECLNEISINELGIALRAFFKNSTQLRSTKMIDNIINKTLSEIKLVDSVHLAAIVKNLRYSSKPHLHINFRPLLRALAPELPRFSLMCLMHIAHFATKHFTYEEQLMEQILERFCQEMSTCRLKDLDRILLSVVMICPDSVTKPVLEKVVQELMTTHKTSREMEIQDHPYSFMSIILYLTYKNIYVQELLQHVFSPAFVDRIVEQRNADLYREFAALEYSVKLECPSYTGPWLKNSMRNAGLSAMLQENDKNPGQNKTRSFITELVLRCEQLYNFLPYVGYVLPHCSLQNIVIAFDQENKPVPISDILSRIPNSEIKYVNTEEHKHLKWLAICPITSTQIVIGTNAYTSLTQAKIRQLKIIGYTPVELNNTKWIQLLNPELRTAYFRHAVEDALKSTKRC